MAGLRKKPNFAANTFTHYIITIQSLTDRMNIAIIIAGGVGNRMGQDIPKQFINVPASNKPVLIYTLEVLIDIRKWIRLR